MPTKPFTGTASYYKMLPLRGPTPLLQNVVGVLMVDQWPMLVHYKKVGGQPKTLPFLIFWFGAFSEAHMLLDEFQLQ